MHVTARGVSPREAVPLQLCGSSRRFRSGRVRLFRSRTDGAPVRRVCGKGGRQLGVTPATARDRAGSPRSVGRIAT